MTSPQLEFFHDSDLGLPQVKVGNAADELLGEFLQSELQGDIVHCKSVIEQIASGKDFQVTGNMSQLQISGGAASLTPLFDENIPPLTMDKTDFLGVVQKWKAFIETG